MTLGQALRQVRHALTFADPDPERRVEAELILMEALRAEPFGLNLRTKPQGEASGLGRAQLYARLGEELPPATGLTLSRLLERRRAGEPVAYLRGRREFYGLDFLVDRRVLIPRPETEAVVEAALAWLRAWPGPCLAADVGTGCGAIAISLAVNLPQATIYATDISREALEVAAANAHCHGVARRAPLLPGDLLEPLPHPVPLIVANLPYVASEEWPHLPPEVCRYEPQVALDGGPEGLEVIRRLLVQAPDYLVPGGALLLEIGFGQGVAVLELARASFPCARLRLLPDLAGIPRVLSVDTGGERA